MPVLTVIDNDYYQIDYGAMVAELTASSWAVMRAAAGDYHESATISQVIFVSKGVASPGIWASNYRFIDIFNCVALPLAATILSAKVRYFGYNKVNTCGLSPYINLVNVALDNHPQIGDGDYDSLGSTELSTRISYADWKIEDWNEFELNPAGIAQIVREGRTAFGLREMIYDLGGATPPWSPSCMTSFPFYGPVVGTYEKCPQLVIDYSLSVLPTVTTDPATGVT